MASSDVVSVVSCEVVDGLSSLMVSGSEELLSAVLRIQTYSHVKCPFPLTVAVPFQANYRGNYREIIVKVVDPGQRVSYVTPVSTEGFFEGQRVCNKSFNFLHNAYFLLLLLSIICVKSVKGFNYVLKD